MGSTCFKSRSRLPSLRRGDPLTEVWAALTPQCGRDGVAPGSASGKHPFRVVCVRGMWPWLLCVVGVVLALGCGVVGLGSCPACMPCLLAAVVVHGWVVRAVGLAPTLGVGCWASVDVCSACYGRLPPLLWCIALHFFDALCAAVCCPCTRVLLWCVLRCATPLGTSGSFVCLGVAMSCAALMCVVRLCSVVCLCQL